MDGTIAEAMRAGWSEGNAKLIADAYTSCHGLVPLDGILKALGSPYPSVEDVQKALNGGQL